MHRTIAPNDLKPLVQSGSVLLIDVRRPGDHAADTLKLPGAEWKNPEQVADWCRAVPKDRDVIIYCVRGGAVSNSIVDALQAEGVKARFIEGGIEAWKQQGGATVTK